VQFTSLDKMVNGWVVGNFSPSALTTDVAEFGVKRYAAGAVEAWHYHKIGTEVTVVVSGRVRMNEHVLGAGSVAVVPPGEGVAFECLEDAVTAVFKTPSIPGDKYGA
jgi:quercetin dioxygenase-like cupin family protein